MKKGAVERLLLFVFLIQLFPLVLSVGFPAFFTDPVHLEEDFQLLCSAGSDISGHFPVGIDSALPEGMVVSGAVLPDIAFAGKGILPEPDGLFSFEAVDHQLITGLQRKPTFFFHFQAPSPSFYFFSIRQSFFHTRQQNASASR